jgi:hypothetical protein
MWNLGWLQDEKHLRFFGFFIMIRTINTISFRNSASPAVERRYAKERADMNGAMLTGGSV